MNLKQFERWYCLRYKIKFSKTQQASVYTQNQIIHKDGVLERQFVLQIGQIFKHPQFGGSHRKRGTLL